MKKINLNLLEAFFALYKQGSYTKSAPLLGCTSTNVAQRIQRLEESMGCSYFVKQNKSWVPTREGKELYERTYKYFHSLETELSSIEEKTSDLHLDIITSTGASLLWVLQEIALFMDKYEKYSFSVHTTEESRVEPGNDYDIIALPQSTKYPEYSLLLSVGFSSQLYASKKYIKKHGMPQNAEDLDQHRIISFYHRSDLYRGNADWILREGRPLAHPRKADLIVNNAAGIGEAIANGIGIGPLTDNSPFIKARDLVPVLPKLSVRSGELNFCYNTLLGNNTFIKHLRKRYPSRKVKSFSK